jgi:predicted RecA/RadA family phage recombinase
MMASFIQKGDTLDYTNNGTAVIDYHEVIPLGNIVGVAAQSIDIGATGSIAVVGVWEVPADTTVAFTVGQALYLDIKNNKAVKDNGDGLIPAGYAFSNKATTESTVQIKINCMER